MNHPHLRRQGTATQLIVNGEPLLLFAGELHNSSASSLDYMAPIWPRLKALNLNAVLATLSWELVEPVEGQFDFTLLDGLVAAAREYGLKLVFLWFGTWKNTISCYAPAWVKVDPARFPRLQVKPGMNSSVLSSFGAETCKADARAFAATMRRIREIDADGTVVMMQAENEVGILGSARDWSPAAQQAFGAPVPEALLRYLAEHRETLLPETRAAWQEGETGCWPQVFGADAAEIFMAWRLATYIDAVAAAGRREYDLPVYANAWLRQKGMETPGVYPSGGPVSRMLDIWRAAAPHLDFIAPDIYVPVFKEVCASYTRSGNPLFIPEAWNDERAASAALYAFGQHDAIGFAPFAIDDVQTPHPLAESYALLTELSPLLARLQGLGRTAGFYQETDEDDDRKTFLLGGVQVRIGALAKLQPGTPPAGGLIIALDEPDAFLVAGRNLWVEFMTPGAVRQDIEFLHVDAGRVERGAFLAERRLNGDETGHGASLFLNGRLQMQRVVLNRALNVFNQGSSL